VGGGLSVWMFSGSLSFKRKSGGKGGQTARSGGKKPGDGRGMRTILVHRVEKEGKRGIHLANKAM